MNMFSNDQNDIRFFGACSVELGLGIVAIVLGIAFGPDPRNGIPAWFEIARIAESLGIGAVVGSLLAGLMMAVGRLPFESIRSLNKLSSLHLLRLLEKFSTPQLITLALTAGVGEELLFRGWVMQSFTGKMELCSFDEIAIGVLASSLIFGMAHPLSILYIVLAFCMGAALGCLYWWTGDLLAPIAAHWIYDAIIMILLVRTKAFGDDSER